MVIDKTKNYMHRILVIKLSPINGLDSSMLRTLALIKGLTENKYNVDFLTMRENKNTIINNIEKYGFLEEVNIIYAERNNIYNAIVSSHNTTGIKQKIVDVLRKVYHAFSPFDYTIKIAKKINIKYLPVSKYQYVISVSDPKSTHKSVRELCKQGLQYEKWIQYWGDPLTLDITKKSIYPQFINKLIEKNLFYNCDSIIYTSPFTVEEQSRLFPQYSDIMKYVPTAYISKIQYPKNKGNYTVGYYGAYVSSVRNITPLYDALSELKEINLIIVGNSDINLVEKENIAIYPRGEISKYEQFTDLYVCILNSTGTQIPGKIYHYAATDRPILIILDGERKDDMKRFFEQFKRYYTCNNDVDAIKKAIISIRCSDNKYEPYDKFSAKAISKMIITE